MAILRLLSGSIIGFWIIAVVHCQLTECDFENSTCQWRLSNGWIRSQGNASNLDTGPKYDDNINSDGFYLHLNGSHLQPDEKSFIFSPAILDMDKKYCLSFLYLMHGKQVATLSVHVSNGSSTSNEVWATSFEHGPEWLHQEVLIENGSQVIFEGVFGGELGDIAIDDIEINEGECLVNENGSFPASHPVPVKCTFEQKGMCGYYNSRPLKWLRGSESTLTSGTGPDNDHTLQTKDGHYMYVEANSATKRHIKARLISPRYTVSGPTCIQFWYNMYGTHINTLNVYDRNNKLWSKQGSQGYGWTSAFLDRGYNRHRLQLKFEAITGTGTKGDIAIDDISIQNGKCPKPVDCAFENTLCAWANTRDDDFDWSLRAGKHSFGPNIDHTIQSDKGMYMFIELNSSRRQGDRARLVSTTITENVKTNCLKFWYNMDGKDAKELRVFVYNQTISLPVWKLVGSQGGTWKFASVPIYPRRENFWFVIEGVVSRVSKSYIAFDDTAFTEGNCQTYPSNAVIAVKKTTPVHPVKPTTPMSITVDPRLILSCSFTKDFCGWQQGKKDKGDWIRTHVATETFYTGPKRDHTTGKGSYIYVEASNSVPGPIRLFSPIIKPNHENMCVRFWYFMYGQDVDTLRVWTYFNSRRNLHLKISGSQAKNWVEGHVFIQMKATFQIVFEATLNGGVFGDIALDDISLAYGPCTAGEGITTPKPGITVKPIPIEQRNCDFESKNICGYERIKGSPGFYWIRNSGGTASSRTGPSTDHTTHTSKGYYMYIEGSHHREGTVARMVTPLYQDSTSVCLQFYYHMYGSGIGDFRIYIVSKGNVSDILLYNATGDHGNEWAVDRVTINKWMVLPGYKIKFEATVGKNYRADIALDDISFSAGKCSPLGDCNFEDDTCTWKNVKNDDFDWLVKSGNASTSGPKFDHTLSRKGGHYLFIDTSHRTKPGMNARWVSAMLPKIDRNMCLHFWYNMNGKSVGSLAVFLQVNGFPKRVLLWHLKGAQGKIWLYARAPLASTASTYTISFEATSGPKYQGDIAIDDISFTENRCTIFPAKAQAKTTMTPHITTPVPPTLPPKRGNFTCNFDRNFCGWKQDVQDDDDWIWRKGSTLTQNTGPRGDHTSGNGHYIYLETSNKRPGRKANFISPTYMPDKTEYNCVSFWYYMYGSHVKTLNVYIQYGMSLPSSPFWSETGNQGERWILGKFSFQTNSPFNVVLSGVTGSSYDGDIAVDDVSITNGDCVDYLTKAYLTCDFEKKDLCGFRQGTADTYNWIWHSGETPTSNTGPQNDHTFGTPAGHYMYIKGAQPKGYGRLSTPSLHTTYTSCVQFYYHMQGNVGRIFAYLSAPRKMTRLWYRSGHQSTAWQQASFELTSNSTRYEIMLEAFVGGSEPGDIAIDDFSIVKGKCSDAGRCDFEKGMCIWRNAKSDDFDWIIKKADGRAGTKAPIEDHTTKVGQFLYASSDHNRPHAKAMIESTDFEPKSKNCLHFWFNGNGKDPGTLAVNLKSRHHSYPIWRLTGTGAKKWLSTGKWQEARVQIPRTTRTFTIQIELVVGKSGYVAIDDIVFDTEQVCSRMPVVSRTAVTEPTTTIRSTLAPTTHPTTPKRVVSSVTCSFDGGWCGWIQDKKDDIDWIRHKGPTHSFMTGPKADHTSKSGYYIYIESSNPTKVGDVARIISPEFTLQNNKKRCLTFWYNMYGKTIGTLSLLLSIKGKMGAPIWKRQKSQGENWRQGQVNIGGDHSLQVVFEANSGSGYYGDIALDDIRLYTQACHWIKEGSPLPSCDFEGTCNYVIMKNYYLPWIITSSSNHPQIPDHTYNTKTGEFVYINMTGTRFSRWSRMMTPVLPPGQYCMEFFYRSMDKFNGHFYIRTSSHNVKTQFSKTNWYDSNNKWTIAEISINLAKSFKVMFETVARQNSQGTLAIDDISFQKGICPRQGSCDFERGHLCFWTNDPTNNVNWEVHTGSTLTRGTGPATDHTKGNVTLEGTYALLETSHPAKPGDKARLISQSLNNKNIKSCFQFWYSMNGRQVASLSISVKSGKVVTKYWSLSGNQGNVWNYGQVPLPALKEDFQIVIEGSVGGKYGDIALDDLFMVENGCGLSPRKARVNIATTAPPVAITTTNTPIISGDNTFNCTFEKATCGWKQSKTDQFDWTRHRGYTTSLKTGPQGDHTTGRGYYMFIETSGYLKRAELVYEATNQVPGIKCMQFWYNMRGPHVGSLNIYIITEVEDATPEWTKSGTQGINWNLAKVEFNAKSSFKVRIEGIRGKGHLGDIAIDDITLQNGGCKEPYGYCDFEDINLCGYTNDSTGVFNWTISHGSTGSSNTGPSADHTYGTNKGHYMYIESSSPRKPNDAARLISPIYKAIPDEHCLQFFYNMYGDSVGELNVKVRVHDSANTSYVTDNYLHIAGEQAENWLLAQLELPKLIVENPYQLIFEGVVGKGYRGDIAIDDIVINYGECEVRGDCDFDNGRCTWLNANVGDDFDWMIGSGKTKSPQTGPTADHTVQNGKGYYLFIDASYPVNPGQVAWYVSQDFPPSFGEKRCITFWYSMNGVGIGTLRVLIQFATGGNNTLWELSKDQGNDWKFGQAPIKSPTSYKIIFEAVRGSDYRGDIALDDIIFKERSCSVKPMIATPRGGLQTLPTITGTTPAIHAPAKTLNCTFDFGMCGWTQDTTDNFDWVELSGPSLVSGTGPNRDHNSNGTGFYLYIPSQRRQGKSARLISPLMRPNGMKCFSVWYHMYGSSISTFNVYVFTGPTRHHPAFHLHGSKRNKWYRADIQFNSRSPYNIILEGFGSWGAKGEIAVDDVSIVDKHCPSTFIGKAKFCNFENKNICGFKQDGDDDTNWFRNNRRGQVKIHDHTYGTSSGHFMYVMRSGPTTGSEYASLSTLVSTVNSTDLCVDFWYYMTRGPGSGKLTVSYLTNIDNFKKSTTIFSRQGSLEQRWLQGLSDIDVSKADKVQIKFYGLTGTHYKLIGLDDVRISPTPCKRQRGDCDFEKDTCNWVNTDKDDFDWTIGSGLQTNTETGPLTDRTLGSPEGSYLYIEPESSFVYEDNSDSRKSTILESETFDKNQLSCFQFYYYMKGAKDGSLEVLLHSVGSGLVTPLWQLDGHQSDNWTLARIDLSEAASTFQVVIKGIRGPRFKGQIAIDDLTFSNKFPCETLPKKAAINLIKTTPVPTTPVPIVGFNCTFDKAYCDWVHDTKAGSQWSRWMGVKGGITSDHTGGGHFLYLEVANLIPSKQASLVSPNITVSSQRCLSFYYYMAGEELSTMQVGFMNSDGLEILWKRVGPQGNDWEHATVNLPVIPGDPNGKILLTGIGPKVGASGFMGIDDVSLYLGECKRPKNSSNLDCDFESSRICGYTQRTSNSIQWVQGSGENKLKKQQPDSDHTYGTGHGHYMYLDTTGGMFGHDVILWSPKLTAPKDSCLKFWYKMSGPKVGKLKVRFSSIKHPRFASKVIWMRQGEQGLDWNPEYVNLNQHRAFYVLFEGVTGRSGGIAIDDVKVMPSCEEPGDCTFDIDACGWHNAAHNDLDWQRLSFRHFRYYRNLPRNDHTNPGTYGHYMFFTSRTYVNAGKKGDLLSVSYDPTSGLCFEFWFIIAGYNYGTLTVFKQSKSTNSTILWQLSQTKGKYWTRATFYVKSSEPYEIILRAVKGSGSSGYIAIDDINYSSIACAVTPVDARVATPSTTPTTTVRTTPSGPTVPPSPYDCTFEENSFCQWTQAKDDTFDWEIAQGPTNSRNTGPLVDHTLGTSTGHFMYIEASNQRPNDTARLVSPVIKKVYRACLSFWYHMYGEDVDSLNVYYTDNRSKRRSMLWSRTGTLTRKWYPGSTIIYPARNYQIIIEGTRGQTYKGDIAVDDIKIKTGGCPEKHGLCTFENGDICGYKQVGDDNFDWAVGSSGTNPYLPKKDHTMQSSSGKYLYVNGKHTINATSQILSLVVKKSYGTCFRFWYNINGSMELNVYIVTPGEKQMLKSYQEETTAKWLFGNVNIKSSSTWEIMFEAKIKATSLTSYVALDDIQKHYTMCGITGDCSFEFDMCYWANENNRRIDNFNWIIKKADNGRTGPKTDHTLLNSKGSYLYIEGSYPQKRGDKAILNGPRISRNPARRCLKFWYSIHGGMLEIGFQKSSVVFWRIFGTHGNPEGWKYAQVPLTSYGLYHRIIIKGTIGAGSKSYIALDDVTFHSSSCNRLPVDSDPRLTTLAPTKPPVTRPPFVSHSDYDCSFEKDFCSWNQPRKGDDFDWKRWQGPTPTIRTGPKTDHTLGTVKGWYAYIESSTGRHKGDKAILVSKPFKSNTPYCFMFYYYMFGYEFGSLNVMLNIENVPNLTLWTRSVNHGTVWIKESFRIPKQSSPFTISFVGQVDSMHGDIALDDIRAMEGECPDSGPLNCTFETIHLCGFTTPENHGVKWDKHSFGKGSRYGPRQDHTLKSIDGTYMFLELIASGHKSGQAQLVSPVIKRSTDLCMSFYYQMSGRTEGYLSVYQQIGNTTDTPIWIHWKISPTFWIKGEVTLPAQDNYRVIFEGNMNDTKGSIIIDDIRTVPGVCPEPGSCSFEKNMCGWKSRQSKLFWRRSRGRSPTENTGPTTDHTLGTDSGYYMYIETSYSAPHHTAILRSMSFPPTTARCMRFWYHMYGKDMGSLKIKFVDEKNEYETLIWDLSHNQGDKWHYAQVAFAWSDVYHIRIEGMAGKGGYSDIAFDDITFTQDYCTTLPITARTHYHFPSHSTTVPPPTLSPTALTCNFEKGLCHWKQGKHDEFDWSMNLGSTPSAKTGPKFDHTYGTKEGHYIYIETSFSNRRQDRAQLESPVFVPAQTGCLQFWYFMYGPDVDTLTVYIKDQGNLTAVWTKTGTIDPAWHQALVPIHSDNKIQIVFEALEGRRYQGDIALDDIAFSFKGCPTSTDMTCGFEDTKMCGFTQSRKDNFNWIWSHQHRYALHHHTDHTSGTPQGHYMEVASTKRKTGQKAIIISPTYTSNVSKCVEFWYFMAKENSGSLNVYSAMKGTRMKLWSRSGPQGDVWSLAQMTVKTSGTFNLEIEAVTDRTNIDISIDDFGLFEGECPKAGNCDFEKGWCTWNNNRTDDLDWQIGTGYLSQFGSPVEDHTTETTTGHFIFLQSGGLRLRRGSRAQLYSEVFDGTYHDCMTFWYYMHGAGTGSLNIYTVTSESKKLSWTLTGDQPSIYWSYGQFPVHHKNEAFKILIEGITGESNLINIAVDDVFFTDQSCSWMPRAATTLSPTKMTTPMLPSTTMRPTPVPTKFDCTFEKGMCQWKQDTGDAFDWIRSQGPIGSNRSGPIIDHTRGNDNGWYIYMDISGPRLPYEKGRLIGPLIPASQDRCFNFWYHMHGSYISSLSVILSVNGENGTRWTKSGDQGDAWWEAAFNLPAAPNTNYQIIFEVTRQVLTNGEIAVDDIRFTKNKCHADKPTYCDFEDKDLCHYTQIKTDDFDWKRTSGRTPTYQTGPSSDHTTGTTYGHYMFIETTGKTSNQKAQLKSPKYNSTSTSCLHFYYYMYGDHVDELNVYKVTQLSETDTPIWSRKYNQGNNWIEGQVTISPGDNYYIIFEGKVGKGGEGDIAIDDIYQTPGACQPPGYCDFETDLCSWKNIKSDDFDWLRSKGYTDTPMTGPSIDHTLGNPEGYYVYLETSDPRAPGQAARLQSVDFPPSNMGSCLRFWYHMNGEDVDTLHVLVQNVNEDAEAYLWTKRLNSGPSWFNAQLNVPSIYTNKPYYLLFEGIRGAGYNGDIAIDDIEVSQGECEIMPSYADPKAQALRSIECNLDDGDFCNWRQSTKDNIDWKLRKGRSGMRNAGPKADHSGTGYYMYAPIKTYRRGQKAVLASPKLGPTTGEGNCFTFYYHMYGMNMGNLNIYTVINGNKTLRWTKSGEQGDSWKHAYFNINSKFNYQIYIESVSSGHYYDFIALDDLTMVGNPCPAQRICDFNVDMCNWTPQHLYESWVHATKPTPIADHTTNTKSGGFLYTNASMVNTTALFRMISPPYPPATKSCLKFWYKMIGPNPGVLSIFVKLPYTEMRLWRRAGNQADLWWQAHIDVGRPKVSIVQPYRLVFESAQHVRNNGTIAIDDVEHLPGPCFSKGVCDFEQDLCGFINIVGDDFDWIRGQGPTDSISTGPLTDHTLKSPRGHYMFMEGSGIHHNSTGFLASEVKENTTGTCFRFWYYMKGDGIGELNLLMWTPSLTRQLWSKKGPQGRDWLSASIDIVSTEPYSLIFQGVRGLTYASDIAIDDIIYLDGLCETQTIPPFDVTTQPPMIDSMFRCDFERNFCGWKQDTTDTADWARAIGSSTIDGPKFDHTKNNKYGRYIRLGSSTMKENRTAILMSDVIYKEHPICLTFYYHMNGADAGTLNVYVRNIGEKKSPVWTKRGAQGPAWRYATIEIAKPEKRNKIYFEAIRGGGRGDISLDDVDLLLDNCPPRNNCDFEEADICGFEQGDNDVFDWTWRTGRTPTYNTGPRYDHTYGTKYGHYMYTEASKKSFNDHAHLYSPVYPATTEDHCLTFWYNMNGKDVAKLNVYLYQNNKIGNQIWSLQMNQGPHWHLATVPVKSETPYQVLFEGIRGKTNKGDIAIDDMQLSRHPCDPVAYCSFEKDICGWENLHDIGGADFDWQRTEASIVRKNAGPSIDHTIGDKSGFYMFVDPTHWRSGQVARLRSQTIPLLPNNPKSYCFQFWYNMQGNNIGQLSVNINYHGDMPQTIWSQGSSESKWRQGLVLINEPYSHFEVVLVAVSGTGNKGYIAIDDTVLKPGICPNMTQPQFTCHSGKKIPSSKVCDFLRDCPGADDEENCGGCMFEDNMCTWVDKSISSYNWTRVQGISPKTKIKKDHTKLTSKGWFVHAPENSVRFRTKAVLQNRVLQQTSSTCQLKFWYYLTGYFGVVELSLGVLEGGRNTELWKRSYHGGGWYPANVDIGKISRPFKLQFISMSSDRRADIAIDDIELENCNFPGPEKDCSSTAFQCESKGCVDLSRICDLSDDCGDASDEVNCQNFTSCDFENSLCEWSQDTNDIFDWTRINGETATVVSGPTRDHSKGTGSGYYIYAEASGRKKGDITRLLSPVIKSPPKGEECWIRFFYHMKGYKMGSLNLYTRTSILGAHSKLWTKRGHIGDIWERADVKLSADLNFQVVFEAEINGYSSDMALDDITFTPGCHLADPKIKLPNGTKPKPTKSPCRSGQFHCKSSECILQSQVCDFKKHCKDGSDEQICGTCNFENGQCGWTEQSTGLYKWQSHQGDSPGKFGPIKDHTSNSDIGKYMMVNGAYGVYRTSALLETRPFGATASTCTAVFYAFMSGDGVGEIHLNIIDSVTQNILKSVAKAIGNQGTDWVKFAGHIGAQPAGFALQFSALPNSKRLAIGKYTDVAIDDVQLIRCQIEPITSTKSPVKVTSTKPPVKVTSTKPPVKVTSTKPPVKVTSTKPPVKVTSKKPTIISTKKVQPHTSPQVLPGVTTTPWVTPKVTPKIPNTCGEDSFTCPAAPNLCFPLAYRCDGHNDCPDSSDEKNCVNCPAGKTYCIPKQQCILSRRCDGIYDCPDGSDESACKECQADLCLNGGTCIIINGSPKCQCKDKNANFRCLIEGPKDPEKSKSKSKKVWAIPVGIVLALVIMAIMCSLIYFVWIRKTRNSYSPQRDDIGITNPAYDYGTSLPSEFPMIDLEPAFQNGASSQPRSNPTSIENPMYGQ